MMIKRFALSFCILACYVCNAMESQTSIVVDCAQASNYAYTPNLPILNKQTNAPEIFNGYHCIHTENIAGSGFTGVTFYNLKTETVITAFRGTDPSIKANIQEDVGICAQIAQQSNQTLEAIVTHQYTQAADYYFEKNPILKRIQSTFISLLAPWIIPFSLKSENALNPTTPHKELGSIIDEAYNYYRRSQRAHSAIALGLSSSSEYQNCITGHSLGGFLAQLVCARNRALTGYTFNAPGADQFLKEHSENNKVYNYARAHDVVGTLGVPIGSTIQLKDLSTQGFGSWFEPFQGIVDFCESNHSITFLAEDLTKDGLANNLLRRDHDNENN